MDDFSKETLKWAGEETKALHEFEEKRQKSICFIPNPKFIDRVSDLNNCLQRLGLKLSAKAWFKTLVCKGASARF